ncbi:glutamate--cysteine ligase [Lysinibacter cavernae]|uniref:Putative glutamate--cysteine ligase 2 n=1 Tax=Lysinibacter cavernae TaxID=1640652 RepID=A0A7X5QYW1_9MICO|nr:glutamate--cysteine ligase [Lysinibacter cavernae]NIH52407.1 carboxylate-amine ligase [Lysinibacter cavernae]
MSITFAPSARSTLGIEWELALVDRESGELSNTATRVLAALNQAGDAPYPLITSELFQNTIELVSGVHSTVAGAVGDLESQLQQVRPVLDSMNLDLIGAGCHPFSRWPEQSVTESARYDRFMEKTQWWGRNMLIWGVHVHVGIEDRSKVLPILHGLLTYYPHLQALSAASPFWEGQDTGYASNRSMLFQQLPTAGLPYDVKEWGDFERYIDDVTRVGIISEINEARWDIRPAPKWGTLEMRACDGLSTMLEVGAVAALTQCLVERLSTELDSGREPMRLQPWFIRENKWRAARYGIDATVIVSREGAERPVSDDLRRLVTELEPIANRLGCRDELASILSILDAGVSSQRQLRVAEQSGGDLRAVVRSLSSELTNGLQST